MKNKERLELAEKCRKRINGNRRLSKLEANKRELDRLLKEV